MSWCPRENDRIPCSSGQRHGALARLSNRILNRRETSGDGRARQRKQPDEGLYDVWICSKHLDFDAVTLLKAIDATFKNRKTPIQAEDVHTFTAAFVEGHGAQWNAFARKIGEIELVDDSAESSTTSRKWRCPRWARLLAVKNSRSGGGRAGDGWQSDSLNELNDGIQQFAGNPEMCETRLRARGLPRPIPLQSD